MNEKVCWAYLSGQTKTVIPLHSPIFDRRSIRAGSGVPALVSESNTVAFRLG
jgi:hypothetical protein